MNDAAKQLLKQIQSSLFIFSFFLLPLAFFSQATAAQAQAKATLYVCPMDREVKSAKPGKCPKCGMNLRAAKDEPTASASSNREEAAGKNESAIKLGQIPDTIIYDQDGRKLRFYNDLVKGKTVAINFIFTTCTTICPPLTATFRKVQQELGERDGNGVELISISVDPTTDVPERLKSFAAKFNAGPGWTFVTGSKPEIDQLLKSLGAAAGDKNDHSPMILVGNDATGSWTRTYGLAPAATLVKVITEATNGSASAKATVNVPMPGQSQSAAARERQVEKRVTSRDADASPAPNSASPVGSETKKKTPVEAAAAYFPNLELLTQDNKPVHFFDDLLKNKTVLINFAFTTCTGVCPPMTANLAKVQQYLGDRVGKDINMITISVDPVIDTPEAIKKYAEKFKVKPGWYFLTGKKENVDRVLQKVGAYVEDKSQHSSILLIGNTATGEWMKVFAMAKPAEIADAVVRVAGAKKE